MKIKLNNKAIAAAVMLLGLVSCKKNFLENTPPDSVSTQIFWASEADTRSAIAGVYSRLQQNYLGYERVYLDALSDNAWAWDNTNQTNLAVMTTGGISPALTGAIANMYSSPYRAITSCNYFLDNVDRAPITDALKNTFKAEVRFIRALCYFDLVQGWGGVPLYDRFFATLAEANVAQSSKEQVYDFINADLDFAIANLVDEKYNGRVIKGSAQALKARVLVTQQRWPEAASLCQQ
ncbi:MAG: RagB/SusD family nutrient uptake outer membrane protein, partial [Pedobacter sp.]